MGIFGLGLDWHSPMAAQPWVPYSCPNKCKMCHYDSDPLLSSQVHADTVPSHMQDVPVGDVPRRVGGLHGAVPRRTRVQLQRVGPLLLPSPLPLSSPLPLPSSLPPPSSLPLPAAAPLLALAEHESTSQRGLASLGQLLLHARAGGALRVDVRRVQGGPARPASQCARLRQWTPLLMHR